MNLSRRKPSNGTTTSKVVCAIAFCLFVFSYIHFLQSDLLAVAQHSLSGGATHYNHTVGTILITIVLLLLQMAVYALTQIHGSRHALTYFPSLLVLTVITSMMPDTNGDFSFGVWPWLAPLLFVVWLLAVYVTKKKPYGKPSGKGILARSVWVNLFTMCAMFVFVGAAGNSNDVLHYRMHSENCLLHDDYDGALSAGSATLNTDNSLTMLRAYALAHKGLLGEKLFTYPLCGKSDGLLPLSSSTHCLIYPTDSIYRFLGARPASGMNTMGYLKSLLRAHKATDAVKDYLLCGYLMDRDLDSFAQLLPRFYKIDNNLPRHYREALTLYTHLRSNPCVTYLDDVMDTDFDDLQELEKQYTDKQAKRLAVFDQYWGTYWWYYEYGTE